MVRGTNWVGDAMMTIPALRELRRIFPNAHITLCTRSWAEGLFQDASFIDEVIIYDKRKSSLTRLLRQSKLWREKKFDLAVILTNSFESALLAKLGRVKYSFGYNREKRGIMLTHPLPVPDWKNTRHEVFYYLNIIERVKSAFGLISPTEEIQPQYQLDLSSETINEARRLLENKGVDLSRKTIALCPGSTNSRAKRWPVDYYAELANMLVEKLDANVLLIGADDEKDISEAIVEKAKHKTFLLTGKTSLKQSAAILGISDLLISNDTGPSHIAPALETKTLVIFGPTNPATTKPFPEIAQIIRKPPDCAPCMLRDCPIDHRCMTAISPKEVLDRAVNILELNGK